MQNIDDDDAVVSSLPDDPDDGDLEDDSQSGAACRSIEDALAEPCDLEDSHKDEARLAMRAHNYAHAKVGQKECARGPLSASGREALRWLKESAHRSSRLAIGEAHRLRETDLSNSLAASGRGIAFDYAAEAIDRILDADSRLAARLKTRRATALGETDVDCVVDPD